MKADGNSAAVPAAGRGALQLRRAQQDPVWVRFALISATLVSVTVLVVIPVAHVFASALSEGFATYWKNIFDDPDTRHAIGLTLTVVPFALAANTVFGISAAWAISRFDFKGRTLLISLIDLPFAVSPVVAGLMFVLIFGLQGYLGEFLRRDGYAVMPYLASLMGSLLFVVPYWVFGGTVAKRRWANRRVVGLLGGLGVFALLLLAQRLLRIWPEQHSLKIIFATPGLILATSFVTFPFVARELIPVMEAIGPDEELAAVNLGASGWRMFWDVTLPNAKWGLIYGVILCNARAMGEFGAVYVVSGHIAGQTDTMPLRVEKLFQEYNLPGSFAVASLLTLVAIFTLLIKSRLERKLPSLVNAASRNPAGASP